ncbi:MAG: restriction endonuclease [Anaerolineaceae bacterium]
MKFKDAANSVLSKSGKPMHYREIADVAIDRGILDTVGRTPQSTMGALLYTDTLRPNSRFRRGDARGTFELKVEVPKTIRQQIVTMQKEMKTTLLKRIQAMPPKNFELLIQRLLDEMGFEETDTTQYSNDGGVDVHGVLRGNSLAVIKLAIQAKRWGHKIGSPIVRNLRGSLRVADNEQGLLITSGDFSPDAKKESTSIGKTPIRLLNGEELVDLLIDYKVGISEEAYSIPVIDVEYWDEILGNSQDDASPVTELPPERPNATTQAIFPKEVFGLHKGERLDAKLLDLNGRVELNGKIYSTVSEAAKVVTPTWKTVNGWDFWKYLNSETGEVEKIGLLRKKYRKTKKK